jgi:hypothetical protein
MAVLFSTLAVHIRDQLNASALLPPGEKLPGIHWIRRWMHMDLVVRTEISCPCWKSKPRLPTHSPSSWLHQMASSHERSRPLCHIRNAITRRRLSSNCQRTNSYAYRRGSCYGRALRGLTHWLKYFHSIVLFAQCLAGPPLWSGSQSSWLVIQRSGFDFLQVVGLERGPLSLVSTIEELLEKKSSGTGLENREYGRGNPLC